MKIRTSGGVGLTAFFTAAVWHELGVAGAEKFLTRRGRLLNGLVKRGGASLGLRDGWSVTNLFLASRHLGLNVLLEQAAPPQIIELAAGLSSRGLNWSARYPAARYIEVDRPAVLKAKRRLAGNWPANLHLVEADVLHTDLAACLAPLTDPHLPTLIIAEGVTGYMNRAALSHLLHQIKTLADCFDQASVLIDFYLQPDDERHGQLARMMRPARLLWRIMRAPMQMFLQNEADIRQLVTESGFTLQNLYSPADLSHLANLTPPPATIFYLAELSTQRREDAKTQRV